MPAQTPYEPPKSEVAQSQPKPSNVAYILAGVALGGGASYIILTLTGLCFFWLLTAQGVPAQELYSRAYQATGYILVAHLIGACCLAYGGFWTARLSSSLGIAGAVVAGALLTGFTLLQMLLPYELPIPAWSQALSLVLPVPAYALGAWWHQRSAA